MALRTMTAAILWLGWFGAIGFSRVSAQTSGGAIPPASDCRLQLDISTDSGSPTQARIRVYCSDGRVRPDTLDQERLVYTDAGGFFYADSSTWLGVPSGPTRITVGKGFEWRTWDRLVNVARDTTVQVVLSRFVDLREVGWYCGDMHAHTRHQPVNYEIPPLTALMVARAEGLNVLHLLDQSYEFTGSPHACSDFETILYYSTEYRNGAYGHVELPGLNQSVPEGCCSDPSPAYPMLLDLQRDVVPTKASMMILAHPHDTDDYWSDIGWPGSGLGRELPVLAALGALDALDVVSYNNIPDYQDFDEWYAILSTGIACPPSAGTDTQISNWHSRPVAAWRVYANVGNEHRLDYYEWIDALKSGRTFVTSYPLIDDFRVGSAGLGEVIEHPDSLLEAPVHLRALCSMGLRRISIVADGATVWTANLFGHVPPLTIIDTTFALSIPTPPWLAARVEGIPANPHAAIGQSLAISSAIRVTRDGAPIRRTAPSGRWLDKLDSLETFVTIRGNWDAVWQRDTVLARIDRARAYYRKAFVLPPDPFTLTSPISGDSIQDGHIVLVWEAAVDPEAGDRISYDVSVARDSLFSLPRHLRTDSTQISGLTLPLGKWYWCVRAVDRALNATRSTPPFASFVVIENQSSAVDEAGRLPPRSMGFPNPSNRAVRLVGFLEPITIFDASGRRVAGSGEGVHRAGDAFVWDGTIRGRAAPAGLYWVRGAGSRISIRLIRVR